jgi:uncharacterized membrane protein
VTKLPRLATTALVGPSLIASILAALVAVFGLGAPASAQWTICNESSYIAEVAIAYPEAERRVTEGWTRVRPGECQMALRQPLTPGSYYLYARSSSAHRGGMREWTGSTPLCVDEGDFSIAGDAVCEDLSFDTRFFLEVPIDGTARRTSLVDPSFEKENLQGPNVAANLASLRIAGIQRLLTDVGYYDRAIDGYTGLRTTRAIEQFVSDQRLPAAPSDNELIDLLEQAALQRADEAGLKLCNRADKTVWTAIAQRRDEGWESRGWWPLGPDECAKVLNEALDQPAYYVYAAIRDPDTEVDRPLAAANEPFCLAPTRFAILGRESCAQRGYEEGQFATVIAQDRPFATLEFTDSDFVSAEVALRR